MGSLLEYSGIVTKTRAMEAKLLTPEQFEEIASCHNVPEVVEFLKQNTAYADILEELAPAQRKYRKDSDSFTLPRLRKALPFLRTETTQVYEASYEVL